MPVEWTVQSADPPNVAIRRIHFVRNSKQPEHLFLNATSETTPETFTEGDVWGVQWTLIRSRRANGQ